MGTEATVITLKKFRDAKQRKTAANVLQKKNKKYCVLMVSCVWGFVRNIIYCLVIRFLNDGP